jgi:hypothetical protein
VTDAEAIFEVFPRVRSQQKQPLLPLALEKRTWRHPNPPFTAIIASIPTVADGSRVRQKQERTTPPSTRKAAPLVAEESGLAT